MLKNADIFQKLEMIKFFWISLIFIEPCGIMTWTNNCQPTSWGMVDFLHFAKLPNHVLLAIFALIFQHNFFAKCKGNFHDLWSASTCYHLLISPLLASCTSQKNELQILPVVLFSLWRNFNSSQGTFLCTNPPSTIGTSPFIVPNPTTQEKYKTWKIIIDIIHLHSQK